MFSPNTGKYGPEKTPYLHTSLSAILNEVFPDEVKLAQMTHLYKKSDPDDKTNYRTKNVLTITLQKDRFLNN